MSKAFTKENDGDSIDDDQDVESTAPAIPTGKKNYITPPGAQRLRTELKLLLNKTRPELTAVVQWAASNGDRSENADYIYGKRRLREIDRRIRFLTQRLEAAEIVDPLQQTPGTARFGATVTVKNEAGEIKTYAIVGVDEIDLKQGRVSWLSPIGSVIINSNVGDTVILRSPRGEEDLEIINVEYLELK